MSGFIVNRHRELGRMTRDFFRIQTQLHQKTLLIVTISRMDVLFEAPLVKERASLLGYQSLTGEVSVHLQQHVLAEYERYERRLDWMRERFHELLMRTLSTQQTCSSDCLTGELLLQLYPVTHTYAPSRWSDDYRQYVMLQRKTPHYPDQLSIPAYAFVEQLADEVLREEGFA